MSEKSKNHREQEIREVARGLASQAAGGMRETAEGAEGMDLLSSESAGRDAPVSTIEDADSSTIGTGEGASGGPSSGTASSPL